MGDWIEYRLKITVDDHSRSTYDIVSSRPSDFGQLSKLQLTQQEHGRAKTTPKLRQASGLQDSLVSITGYILHLQRLTFITHASAIANLSLQIKNFPMSTLCMFQPLQLGILSLSRSGQVELRSCLLLICCFLA